MGKTTDVFIALLRGAITGKSEKINIDEVNLDTLYRLAKFHDMAHIVYYELDKMGILPEGEVKEKLRSCYDIALLRHFRRMNAIERVRTILENERVTFAFLKGVYLMELYPKSWMRTSADIDLIVPENEYDKAISLLSEKGLTFIKRGSHDAAFETDDGVNIELHYTLIEEYRRPSTAAVLNNFWEHTQIVSNKKNERMLDDDMFYYYHIAHMVKHFENGGCGVRSFLDMYLLNNRVTFDREKRAYLLEKGKVLTFENNAYSLSKMWFSANEKISELETMERYVLSGGVLGTQKNRSAFIANRTGKRGMKYYFSRLFPKKEEMKGRYPVLRQKPHLMPVYRIKRLCALKDNKIMAKAKAELNAEKKLDNTSLKQIEFLMNWLDLR